jgi:hypothetical protein
VETLLEFKYLLAGTNITVHTNNKNLLSVHSNSDRVYWWKFAIQEFNLTYEYVKGDVNFIADTLSRINQVENIQDATEQDIEDSFLFYPLMMDIECPILFSKIAEAQEAKNY